MWVEGAAVRCPVPVADLTDAPHAGVLWRAERGRLLLDVPGVARYLTRDGNLVEIDPRQDADEGEVRRFLRMTPAAALYLQRGIPVLHAAVASDAAGRAVVLAGGSGAGKSVMLTTLLQRGWGMLSDDLAPITLGADGTPVAVPTWPEVRLPPGCPARAVTGLADTFIREARPITAIWWLGALGPGGTGVRGIDGMRRFEAFGAMAYNSLIASALVDRTSYLRIAGAVAGSDISLRGLQRPSGRCNADQLADIIEAGRIR